jgi:hypothetical protein
MHFKEPKESRREKGETKEKRELESDECVPRAGQISVCQCIDFTPGQKGVKLY